MAIIDGDIQFNLITLFGWAMVIAGVIRMALPNIVQSMGDAMLKRTQFIRALALVWLVIGAGLTYAGYF